MICVLLPRAANQTIVTPMLTSLFQSCFKVLTLSKMSFMSVFLVLGSITLCVIVLCAPILFWAESQNPDANIQTFTDAVWLSFMIVTTIGFGDFYPVTLIGRLVAVPLAATGIGVFGTLAGYFGSTILDSVLRQTTTDMLHAQNQRIEELSEQNRELNAHIKEVACENRELNQRIVEIAAQNEKLNREILQALQNRN